MISVHDACEFAYCIIQSILIGCYILFRLLCSMHSHMHHVCIQNLLITTIFVINFPTIKAAHCCPNYLTYFLLLENHFRDVSHPNGGVVLISWQEIKDDRWCLSSFHKQFMSSELKSFGNCFYCNLYFDDPIRSQLCTCHDSSAVVACTKLWPYLDNYFSSENKNHFYEIWIMSSLTLCEMGPKGLSQWDSHFVDNVLFCSDLSLLKFTHFLQGSMLTVPTKQLWSLCK